MIPAVMEAMGGKKGGKSPPPPNAAAMHDPGVHTVYGDPAMQRQAESDPKYGPVPSVNTQGASPAIAGIAPIVQALIKSYGNRGGGGNYSGGAGPRGAI